MTIYPNLTKRGLKSGLVALGMGARLTRTVDIASIGKTCGFDWLFLDLEHTTMSLDTAAQISVAALPIGITPLVRIPSGEFHYAARMLENGAQGVIFPHIETAQDALTAVSHCRYPPAGIRSVGGAQPQCGFRSAGSNADALERETLVVVMLESARALENASSIAQVSGIDVLMIGTGDLSNELGIPGQVNDQRIQNAYRHVIAQCKKHGLHAGMGGVHDDPSIRGYIDMGVQFVLSGSDFRFVMSAAQERVRALRKANGVEKPSP